jgi:hypothetical protein
MSRDTVFAIVFVTGVIVGVSMHPAVCYCNDVVKWAQEKLDEGPELREDTLNG